MMFSWVGIWPVYGRKSNFVQYEQLKLPFGGNKPAIIAICIHYWYYDMHIRRYRGGGYLLRDLSDFWGGMVEELNNL